MSNLIIADNKPLAVKLQKGKEYHFCACGRSGNQPFCDGSHQGTLFTPKAFIADKDQEAYWCACKHTGNAPFCDGTHKRFIDDQVGKEASVNEDRNSFQTEKANTKKQWFKVAEVGELKNGETITKTPVLNKLH